MSSAHMLWKIEYIWNCLHVRQKWDNAPFQKVLSIHRDASMSRSTRDTCRESKTSTADMFREWKMLKFPLCCFSSSIVHCWRGKKLEKYLKKGWIHGNPRFLWIKAKRKPLSSRERRRRSLLQHRIQYCFFLLEIEWNRLGPSSPVWGIYNH